MAQQTKTVFVIHAYEPPDGSLMLRLNLGDEWWNLPTGEPVEIEQGAFFAEKIIEVYGPVYGIVEAPGLKTRNGISIDPEAATAMARNRLQQVETDMLNKWVMEQRSDRVKQNLPVLPPTGRVEEIIKSRNIDLKAKYNLQPVGYEGDVGPAPAPPYDIVQMEALKHENETLKAEGVARDAVLADLAQRLGRVESAV